MAPVREALALVNAGATLLIVMVAVDTELNNGVAPLSLTRSPTILVPGPSLNVMDGDGKLEST